jgi:hypothetical protein
MNEQPTLPVLIVDEAERRRIRVLDPGETRLHLCDRVGPLSLLLAHTPVAAVVIETRDVDGYPVPAALQTWAAQNPLVPLFFWTAGGEIALGEMLDLAVAGGDVRLILRGRDGLGMALERLLAARPIPHPGAVPALLRGVVLTAPAQIQSALTMAAFQAWPRPSVEAWASALRLTRQGLNARLAAAGCAPARVVMDCFAAAEIAIRCALGSRLRQVVRDMGRMDDRSSRRILGMIGCRPEQLRDESDFRALIPRIAQSLRR